MKRRRWMTLLLLLIGLAAVSCGGEKQQAAGMPAPGEQAVSVVVHNDAFWDANIYLLQHGTRFRLGMANGYSTATFELPRSYIFGVSDLRFMVDFIGRTDGAVSETILAAPGDQIELTIRE